jgi:hypothetical protein
MTVRQPTPPLDPAGGAIQRSTTGVICHGVKCFTACRRSAALNH